MNITIKTGSIEDVLAVDSQIPEFDGYATKQTLSEKLTGKNALILIATYNSKDKNPIAYKLGYGLNENEFYSWLGGVVPAYRKQGIATQLRLAQERWVKDNGYKLIRVKSMNRFPNMLQLLISSGYKISGYEDNGDEDNSKVRFVKYLTKEPTNNP